MFVELSALFNFESFLTVLLLAICTCTYLHERIPSLLDNHKTGFMGSFWKFARIGERLSPAVCVCCVLMGIRVLFS